MVIKNETKDGKIAARIINFAGKINKNIRVTISERSPESIRMTGTIPSKSGWMLITDIPQNQANRNDYVQFLKDTKYKEIHIRVSTQGGHSKVYVR